VRSSGVAVILFAVLTAPGFLRAQNLPGTKLLTGKDDFAKVMVEGIDRYLDRQLANSPRLRDERWQADPSSPAAYEASLNPRREKLARVLGVVDRRLPPELELVATTDRPAVVAETERFKVSNVRWAVLPGLHAEGLLLEPKEKLKANVIVIPDADQPPEMLVGLMDGVPPASQIGRRLADRGARVLIPTLINRQDTYSGELRLNRWTNQTHREFVYRQAYEMGRHVIGYELQKVLAGVDWFARDKDHAPIAVFGYVEGGLLALYAGALDPRIQATVVSGHFGPREKIADEPIDRNVWGLLKDFGDAELARMIAPRALYLEHGPVTIGPPPPERSGRTGAAPGRVPSPSFAAFRSEVERIDARTSMRGALHPKLVVATTADPENAALAATLPGLASTMERLGTDLGLDADRDFRRPRPAALADIDARQKRQFDEAVAFTQRLLGPSADHRREQVGSRLDTTSLDRFTASQASLRDQFWETIIGKLPKATLPLNPRTRLAYDTLKWKGYEVVFDVNEDVIAFGILLVPNDIRPGERRPVVVCQHGLEGRPSVVVDPSNNRPPYNAFGARLADRGFVVYAPQNPYIFGNRFRQLVRKANPLGLSLYSFIVAQHDRILDWLETLPFVDDRRIAYYGLSYGGKVAMRIPAILTRYCLSICSGDFNEWVWKNVNLLWPGSYMFTNEYDMYEFDLGHTFNYAEMAALIAPRPFMVERGHADTVGLDEYVAFEYAKVRRLYARLGIADRTEIEFFDGGHMIHGQGTFAFLHRHLRWPMPRVNPP
jgi:dienelactone hydrolase